MEKRQNSQGSPLDQEAEDKPAVSPRPRGHGGQVPRQGPGCQEDFIPVLHSGGDGAPDTDVGGAVLSELLKTATIGRSNCLGTTFTSIISSFLEFTKSRFVALLQLADVVMVPKPAFLALRSWMSSGSPEWGAKDQSRPPARSVHLRAGGGATLRPQRFPGGQREGFRKEGHGCPFEGP